MAKMKTGHCEIHGDYEYVDMPILGSILSQCPKCAEIAEKKQEEEEEAKRLEESKKAEKVRRQRMCQPEILEEMGIQKRYYEAGLENYTIHNELQAEAKKAIAELIRDKTGIVVLMGSHGVGKTHLACAALRNFGTGHRYNFYEMGTMIRQTYSNASKVTELQVTKGFAKDKFLVIDEIGRTSCTDAERNWLSYIIDERFSNNLPTLLLSNYPMRDVMPKDYKGMLLDDVFGTDIISRLSEAKKCRISGADMRQVK